MRPTGGRAERPVEKLLVVEPVPEFAFEAADRNEVLRGAGVFVRSASERREQPGGQVGQLGQPRCGQFG
jgi:hypothetical protein